MYLTGKGALIIAGLNISFVNKNNITNTDLSAYNCRIYFKFMKPFRIALCQTSPCREVDRSVSQAFSMIDEAAAHGAKVTALPELFYLPYEMPLIKKQVI